MDKRKQLDAVLDRVRNWPEERQEDAARMLETLEVLGTGIYCLSPQERASVLQGLAEADRGEFVPDEDMQAFWHRHRK